IGLCVLQRALFFGIANGVRVKSPRPMHPSTILSVLLKTQECEFKLGANSTVSLVSMATVLEPLTARIALHGRPWWVYPEIFHYGREWHHPRAPESKKTR